ncbi:MAG: response regulator transcription factor [Chitinophagaceae bacterium]
MQYVNLFDSKIANQLAQLFGGIESNQQSLDKHQQRINLFKQIESDNLLNDSFLFGIDYSNLTYHYISPSVEKIIGLTLPENGKLAITELIKRIKPAYLTVIVSSVLPYFQEFIDKNVADLEQIKQFRFSYNYEMLTAQGPYRHFIQKLILLEVLPNKQPLYDIGFVSPTHFGDKKAFVFTVIEELQPNGHYIVKETKEFSIENNHTIFSNREMEIIQLIVEGASVKEISNRIFISEHTVKVHKRNIFAKAKVQRATELIAFCKKNNIIY